MKLKNFTNHWPLIILILLLLICIAVIIFVIFNQNQGHFIYTLDDTYIHMAMAKNLSEHGVWGITKHAFTSSSSSLFWTAFLAFIFFITGPNEIAPIIISMISGILLFFPFYFVLKKENVKPLYIFIVLLLLVFLVNLPFYIITGLEHTLHALITILFIVYASNIISGMRSKNRDLYVLFILAFLLPLLRYEGLVSILILFVLLLLQRKFLLSFGILLAGAVPISIFGLISISKGWSFFPNSMLMKWEFPDITSPGDLLKLISDMSIKLLTPFNISLLIIFLSLLTIGYYYFKKHRDEFSKDNIRDIVLILFYMADAVLYYIFSMSKLSPRYQHFLIVMAVFISAVILLKRFPTDSSVSNKKMQIGIVSGLIILFPSIIFLETSLSQRYQRFLLVIAICIFAVILFKKSRPAPAINKKINIAIQLSGLMIIFSLIIFLERPSNNATINIPRSSTNIYEQQYQTAQFLKRFYEGKEIAINDIGAPGYFADIKIVDLWGLADMETAKMRRANNAIITSKNDLRHLALSRNIKIAIIYDAWFIIDGNNFIPEEWIKVGEWKILNNIVCSSDKVSIYAVNNSEKDNLINNLKLNSAYLPPTVIQSGIYTQSVH